MSFSSVNFYAYLFMLLSLTISGCSKLTKVISFQQKNAEFYEVPTEDAGDGATSANVRSDSTAKQKIIAREGDGIDGTMIVVPPGSLSVDSKFLIEKTGDFASTNLAKALGLNTNISNVGKAVKFSSDPKLDATNPMSISIPAPNDSGLTQFFLGADDNWVVFFESLHVSENGTYWTGIIPRSEFKVADGMIVLEAKNFGTYQAAVVSTAPTKKVEKQSRVVDLLASLPIPSSNSAPTISDIANQSTTMNGVINAIAFTVGDPDASDTLTVSATSSNTALLPVANIVFVGSGSSRTMNIIPATGQTGTATVTVKVTDNSGAEATDSFDVVIGGTNTSPTITAISDITTNEDTPTPSLSFTIGDAESSPASLTVSATSSSTSVVADAGITLSGTGTSRSLTVSPVANASGTSTITVLVSDGSLSTSTSFLITVSMINDPPIVSIGAPTGLASTNNGAGTSPSPFVYSINEDISGSIPISASDIEGGSLSINCSGAPAYVTESISQLTLAPTNTHVAASQNFTCAVSDGTDTTNIYFTGTVVNTNDAPTISDIGNLSINEDNATPPLNITLADPDVGDNLSISGSSNNTTLVLDSNIVVSGSGLSRAVVVTPAANQSGTATITLTVTDSSGASATDVFVLTVNAVNDAPTISDVGNQVVDEDTQTNSLSITLTDPDAGDSLTMSGTSSNTALVPDSNIQFNGSGFSRSVVVTPVANQSGTATITLRVTDSASATATDTFVLTVSAVNDAPTITDISNQTINEDTNTAVISFAITDVDAGESFTVSGSSSNTAIVPDSNIAFSGSGALRGVVVMPAADQNGSAVITITVNDSGGATVTDTFTLSVTPVNDVPSIAFLSSANVGTVTGGGTNSSPFLIYVASGSTNGDVSFNLGDVDTGDVLTLSCNDGLSWITEDQTNDRITFNPGASLTYPVAFQCKVNDGTIDSASSVYFETRDTSAPSAATGLMTRRTTSGPAVAYTNITSSPNIYFGWTKGADGESGITRQDIYIYNNSACTSPIFTDQLTGAAEEYPYFGAHGSTYWFKIKTTNGASAVAESCSSTSIKVDTSAPTSPSGSLILSSTTSYTSESPTLTWGISSDLDSGIAGYEVAIGSTSVDDVVAWTSIANVTSYKFTGLSLTSGSTYFARVRAVNGAGSSGGYISSFWTAKAWVEISPSGYASATFTAVHFKDANNGIVVGNNSSNPLILLTNDGGSSWTTPTGALPTALNGRSVIGLSMLAGTSTGFALAHDNVFITTDYGANWVTVPPPAVTLSNLTSIKMTSTTVGYISTTSGCPLPFTGYKILKIVMSADLTSTTVAESCIVQATQSLAVLGTGTASDSIWAGGSLGSIFKSIDAGSAWSNSSAITSTTIRGIWANNTNNLCAVGGSKVTRSTNGGQNWNSPTTLSSTLYGITGFSNDIWIVGNSVGYRSTDNCANSTPMPNFPAATFKAVHFIDANTGWIVGDGGKIYKTITGGWH